MDYSTCYNCGQQGHFASSCPLGIKIPEGGLPANHPPKWRPEPRHDQAKQTRINERGAALCHAALASARAGQTYGQQQAFEQTESGAAPN